MRGGVLLTLDPTVGKSSSVCLTCFSGVLGLTLTSIWGRRLLVRDNSLLRGLRLTSGLWGNDWLLKWFRRVIFGELGYCNLWGLIRFSLQTFDLCFLSSSILPLTPTSFSSSVSLWYFIKNQKKVFSRWRYLLFLLVIFFWLSEESLLKAFHLFKQGIPVQLPILTGKRHWCCCCFRTWTPILFMLIYNHTFSCTPSCAFFLAELSSLFLKIGKRIFYFFLNWADNHYHWNLTNSLWVSRCCDKFSSNCWKLSRKFNYI